MMVKTSMSPETSQSRPRRAAEEDGSPTPYLLPNQTAPSVPPARVDLAVRHRSDPNRKRATYGVPYPTFEVVLEKKADLSDKLPPRFENGRRTLLNLRFRIVAADLNFADCDFIQCKLHRPGGTGEPAVVGVTWIGCTFEKCIFGGTVYRHVRFVDCRFKRCDFGTTQFIDSHFQSCAFEECTGEYISLASTQVAPIPLLSGMPAPHYNYSGECDGELTSRELNTLWLEVRRALAAQLFKSNEAVCHTTHCDAALYALKAAELEIRSNSLRYAAKRPGLSFHLKETVACGGLWLLLKVTKGGTSIARLMGISALAIPVYAVALSFSTVAFQGRACSKESVRRNGLSLDACLWRSKTESAHNVFMGKSYRPYYPDEELLLPPSLRDWLPEKHLAYFVNGDVIDNLDLSAIDAVLTATRRRGQPPYDLWMMTKVLVYAYCVGVFSSRRIERRLVEDIAFRVLAVAPNPTSRTISDFRKIHLKTLEDLFEQVLHIALEMGP